MFCHPSNFQNISLKRKDILHNRQYKFPDPTMIHQDRRKTDFQYFWQIVKRQKKFLHAFSIDEDKAIFDGILEEKTRTIHLLGFD